MNAPNDRAPRRRAQSSRRPVVAPDVPSMTDDPGPRRGPGRPPLRQQQPRDFAPIDRTAAQAPEPTDPPRRNTVDVEQARGDLVRSLRGEMREELRADMRSDDERARAARRVAELLGDDDDMLDIEGEDKFYIDPLVIPDHWSYNWKRMATIGKEDHQYLNDQRRMGWEPVPTSRHPEMMPPGTAGNSAIIREGLILMERPREITDLIEKRMHRAAVDQVRSKEAQLRAAPPGTFARGTHQGAPVYVNKGYEPIPVPKA